MRGHKRIIAKSNEMSSILQKCGFREDRVSRKPKAESGKDKGTEMNDFLVLIAIIVAWFVLNRYVLPRFGVKT